MAERFIGAQEGSSSAPLWRWSRSAPDCFSGPARSCRATRCVQALASRIGTALGQPVRIGGIGVAIVPRLSVNLKDVTIGDAGRVSVQSLGVATDLRALLSRRIEHATLRLSGAHVTLPLPPMADASTQAGAPAPPTGISTHADASASPAGVAGASSASPVDLVSVDEILLNDVEITSGGRSLRGDVDLGVNGQSVTIRRITLRADTTTVTITGMLTDLAGPSGDLTVKAGDVNVLDLVSFLTAFSSNAGLASTPTSSAPHAPPPTAARGSNLTMSIDADRATIGALTLDALSGHARLAADTFTIDPIRFGVFGGTYDGSLALSLGETPAFQLSATLSHIDVGSAMAFTGHSGVVTGTLAGRVSVSGRGLTADDVIASAHGTVRADITNGTVAGLGLLRPLVLATSMRAGTAAAPGGTGAAEPFTRLGTTLTIANGAASTTDLRFESPDLLLAASGSVRLDGASIAFAGPLQLSDQLSKQAGRDLVRYTQQDGRVTVPVTVTGSADHLDVGLKTGELARRAVTHAVTGEAAKALSHLGLGRGGH